MKFTVRKVTKISEENLNIIADWYYMWWGKKAGRTKEWVAYYLRHCMNSNKLPISVVAFDEQGEAAGICQVSMQDLDVRPDIYPYLAKVFVAPKYRGNGLVKKLLACAIKNAKKLGFEKLYLFTTHVGLYDKYGWEYIGPIKTFKKGKDIQRFYQYIIK